MSLLTLHEASARLNVAPRTLQLWGARYGFPAPAALGGMDARYCKAEILLLRTALHEGMSVAAAIQRARQSVGEEGSTSVTLTRVV